MNLTIFQLILLAGIYGGLLIISAGLQGIYRRLGEILQELSGDAQRVRDEMDFHYRSNSKRGKE